MSIAENFNKIKRDIPPDVKLIAVTKTRRLNEIMEVYHAGHKTFGENRVQEMTKKHEQLPKDIEWHLIGHLQTNKVKYIAPFVSLIHSVDSLKLLQEIDKQAIKNNRIIPCLLEMFIASEETKFGLDFEEAEALLESKELTTLKNIEIKGIMGMASNTPDESQVKKEFASLFQFFNTLKQKYGNHKLETLSMGMSSDYKIAIEAGSTMVRIGSAVFR